LRHCISFLENIVKICQPYNEWLEKPRVLVLVDEFLDYAIIRMIRQLPAMDIIKDDNVKIMNLQIPTHQALMKVSRFENKDIIFLDCFF
jgi:hypothetical protein